MLRLLALFVVLLSLADARVASRAAQGIVAKGGGAQRAAVQNKGNLGAWQIYTEELDDSRVVVPVKVKSKEQKQKKPRAKAEAEQVRPSPLLEKLGADYALFVEWLDPTNRFLMGF